MAHGDYDCCACCDAKGDYNEDAYAKEDFCAVCAGALADHGVEARTAEEFNRWLDTVDVETGRRILEAVGFQRCCYSNPTDEIYNRRFAAEAETK